MLPHTLNLMEICAVICGVFNVYLAARTSNWNWLFGIISICLYAAIFFKVKLYADMVLQFFFLSMQAYGLYRWRLSKYHHRNVISHAPRWVYGILVIGGLCTYWLLHWVLLNYTDSTTTHLDAITTAFSFYGQWMLSEKWIENWFVWVFVDVLSLQMYFSKQLYFTVGLYAMFLVICLFAYRNWMRQLHLKIDLTTSTSSTATANVFM